MLLKIPEIFASKIDVQRGIRKVSLMRTIVFWFIDTRTRQRVNLASWIKHVQPIEVPKEITNDIEEQLPIISESFKICRVARWVRENIIYIPDIEQYNATDKWAEPAETLKNRKGDCDDGAILMYSILKKLGIPDDRLRIVCGNVQGGGHSYLVWLSDFDGLEYVVDWCFFGKESTEIISTKNYLKSYTQRKEYNYGAKEWFSYNSDTSFGPLRLWM